MNSSKTPSSSPEASMEGGSGVEGGRKRATINDIARLAGVSKKTVSRVINQSPFVRDETRERIEAVIAEWGYAPDPQARGLAFRRSFLIGMIYDNPNPQYVVNMQLGLLDGMRGSGFELVVHPCDRASPTFLTDIRAFVERQKLFGVVLPPSVSEDERVAKLLNEIGCAYIRIASVELDKPEHMIVGHDRMGAAEAARHIVGLGHRTIAFISGPDTFRSSHERRGGFEDGLAEAGLKLGEGDIVQGAYTFESGVACGDILLARTPRPTAIFCGNDEMAAGVLQSARKAGLSVPADLSVVGFDDFQIAQAVWPPLTTIRTPTREIGRMAAEKLIGVERREPRDMTKTEPTLVVRESSGPVPA
ncbi:LacI family DNA-binding transcriptional regulator [Caulobacter sp. 602-1]|uniref:LacI family DNA-binding transcriptional regulator n=1 Tax=Caulobacter sp. 602-1 TaxID=2492472 RepID=UPI000F640222|nr:LacI family DNA-binding transcriptional regulator [Caulobacter sp. 602-1]RRN63258.1 LacI family DNA-binding transcriptional regulator [Caulobacter sp. 602-1]